MGYQVKLINPSTRREVIREVDNLGTFYVLVKVDEEYKQVDTEVQVFKITHERKGSHHSTNTAGWTTITSWTQQYLQ